MTLGEKIRQARQEAGLSQRQLCGEEITRNMLSQIENGSASPSMGTLSYFARQLGKPVSWFLEETAETSPNARVMEKARQAYGQGAFQQTLELLQTYREPDTLLDGEYWLLKTVALMGAAEQALDQGKQVYAQTLLEQAKTAGGKTPYFIPAMEREWTLLMYCAQPSMAARLELSKDDRELYLRAEAALEQGDPEQSGVILDAAWEKNERWHFLRGRVALMQKDYTRAAEHYRAAEKAFPIPCAQALEQCYRELEDYKLAYYYACKQRG